MGPGPPWGRDHAVGLGPRWGGGCIGPHTGMCDAGPGGHVQAASLGPPGAPWLWGRD